jgi:GDPmannose 4,6-dehydratase
MLQQEVPDDYVVATGETYSIKEFAAAAFDYAGLGPYEQYVEIDERHMRPAEVDHLIGDASKAKRVIGWEPKVRFDELVAIMVDSDLKAEQDKL